jgi:hypothetical protein
MELGFKSRFTIKRRKMNIEGVMYIAKMKVE